MSGSLHDQGEGRKYAPTRYFGHEKVRATTKEAPTIYLALVDLDCHWCHRVIPAGQLFTRRQRGPQDAPLPRGGRAKPLYRSCRTCYPFKVAGKYTADI